MAVMVMIGFGVRTGQSIADGRTAYYARCCAPGLRARLLELEYLTSMDSLNSSSCLQVFDTQGRLSGVLTKPQSKSLSNVAFAGPKMDTVYVTSADKVYARRVQATGVSHWRSAANELIHKLVEQIGPPAHF
jgi:hypothetical protein